jgi:hypothetical protein
MSATSNRYVKGRPYSHICAVYLRYFFAGKSPNVQSYTVYLHGSDQPSVCATHMKAREHRLWGRQGHSCLAQCQPVLVAFRAVKVLCLSWCYQCQCLLCTHQQCITAASQINSIALLSVFAMHTPTVYHCYQCPLCTHQQCIIAISVRYAHANSVSLLSVSAMHTPIVYHCYQCLICTRQQCITAISVRYAHANSVSLLSVSAMHTPTVCHCYQCQCPLFTRQHPTLFLLGHRHI